MPADITARYSNCISDFVAALAETFADNLQVIILHGGLVRDREPIEHWSDIDLIVILDHYAPRVTPSLSTLVERLERKHDVRLDINLLYRHDYESDQVNSYPVQVPLRTPVSRFHHSEIINALNQRGTRILYGCLNARDMAAFDETAAAYSYLSTVQNLFRRYYIENIFRPTQSIRNRTSIQRIIRWVFSIIRASLRLSGIYVNPYHESVVELIRLNLISDEDTLLLKRLMTIREDMQAFDALGDEQARELYSSVELFIERYVHEVLTGRNSTTTHAP
jgi:hypothetical protein